MRRMIRLASILPLLALSSCGDGGSPDEASADIAAAKQAESIRQQLFIRVFGDAARLDPLMVAKVRNDGHGKRHYVDVNGDGTPDEVWFIDTCPRHPAELRPVLVRVIDEDGDLLEGHEPDFDSDLYIVDWGADGMMNAVVDYTDRTGDNSVDEMLIYYPTDDDRLMIWWSEDIGNDNLLWYDVGYMYDQAACQYRTHFGGSEIFVAFTIGLDDDEWIPAWENPFTFHDHIGDGLTEEVIRYEGRGDVLHKVRYSFDADGDATREEPRDFDVSISAHSREGLRFDDADADRRVIRGIPTGRFLSHDAAPRFALEQTWDDMMLCWVEDDLNIDSRRRADGSFLDAQERWEGVIARGSEFFEQIGGPPVCAFNKRFEVATGSNNRIEVYFAPTDQRIHLYGAVYMWTYVDADYDLEPEHLYLCFDRTGDGFIDTWVLDADLDGSADDVWHSPREPFSKIPYRWETLNAVMRPLLEQMPEALYALNQRLRDAVVVAAGPGGVPRGPWDRILSGFEDTVLDAELRLRLLTSRESLRYFLDVQKDLLILALKRSHDNPGFWNGFNSERSRGNVIGMRALVEEHFGLRAPPGTLQEALAPIRAAFAEPKAGWAEGWIPHAIAWESDLCGYHASRGNFGFFGKTEPGLVLDLLNEDGGTLPAREWGVDALHPAGNGGLGGLTLHIDGTEWPVCGAWGMTAGSSGARGSYRSRTMRSR